MSEFDKIIGYEMIKNELQRFISVLKEPERYLKLGVKIPSGILLCGNPGLGKTLMAKCFIAETGCKAFTLRKEKPNGAFVDQIKETFENAKRASEGITIIFLDDMDKFANEDEQHRDAEEYVTIQSCIDDCKEEGVFVLATVNDRNCLPDSLLRVGRFDKIIELEAPEGRDAELIIRHFLDQKQTVGNIDAEEIYRIMESNSCAELETAINEAGIFAGYAGRDKIEQEDILKACIMILAGSIEKTDRENLADTKKIAIHEAGHAVVAEILQPGCVSLVSLCRFTNGIEGFVRKKQSERQRFSKELLEYDVMSDLGGKAAIEMAYGIADVGCYKDIRKAYRTVERFVDDYCVLGFDTFTRNHEPSQYMLTKKDQLIAAELERYYQNAKRILLENRAFFDAIVEALMEKKTLTWREVQKIRGRYL